MKSIVLAMAVALAAAAAQAGTVYKCTDENDKVTFSQQPCDGENVSKITVKAISTTGGGAPLPGSSPEYQAITERVEDRMTNVKIRNAQNRIKALTNKRDDLILGYRKQMMLSTNTVAGLARNQKYQQMIDATRETYNSKINTQYAKIRDLRRELND